jgi:two-component system, LuxR family, sensor kinase FixL
VLADGVQINQVFFNLLRNAADELQKCPPGGRCITVTTKGLTADIIELSVADSGPGLDPFILDKLCKPFTSTKTKKGIGVGLSICRRIVEAHGGTFDGMTSPDGGAVFRFTLRRAPRLAGANA